MNGVRLDSATGRSIILATVLGSGVAFLDGTVVNVALPAIGRELGGGLSTLQWVLDGYLLTLGSLLLLGGALGDRYGHRKVFAIGLVAFTVASCVCGIAWNAQSLVIARLLQGAGGALMVPGSLAIIEATMHPDDRGRAIGRWAGLAGVSTALGPFVGGWLVDAASWRFVFFINVPIAAVAFAVTLAKVPETSTKDRRLDYPGAVAVTAGLGGSIYALIEGPVRGWHPLTIAAGVVGVLALVAFAVIERRQPDPLLPPRLLRSRVFVSVNLTTLAVYAALSGGLFLLTLQLQETMGYSALEAGLATLPLTVVMLLLSGQMGALAQKTGPRLPLTVGPVLAGVGVGLLALARPGTSFAVGVLPGMLVFALGMAVTVAPLTATVMASVEDAYAGVASGTNNAVSRIAGLLAVAILPLVSGAEKSLAAGYPTAMLVAAGVCLLGGLVSWFGIGRRADGSP
ncbi:MFS transporter [Actinocorallia sp. A-T 12471]|uniref:MFS transporter n=1 Tax=Actinocorallia sp. A-T 12471 TaxID=3089813 RepID=UPI0029CBEF4B|nr:MFS transporter [Actinocorallia sp. A-T 12471]MDX6738860.1 MFS transporter [Actinocorallia sp. A-T 12471]